MRRRASTTGEIILRVYLFNLYMPNKISRTTCFSWKLHTARALLEAETFFPWKRAAPSFTPGTRARAPSFPTMMKIPALFVLLTATSIARVASYGVIHRHDHIDDERYERHVRAMYALDDLLSEYNRLHDHPDPDYHRKHREPEFVKAHKDTHHHHAQHARRKEALHKAHGDVPIACDDFVSMQANYFLFTYGQLD